MNTRQRGHLPFKIRVLEAILEFFAILRFGELWWMPSSFFENIFRDENTLKGQQRVAWVSSAV